MSNWTTAPQPFGPNRHPLLEGLSALDGATPVPVAVDPATGALSTSATFSASSIALNDGAATTRKASVLGLTDANPLTVAIVDANGDQIASFGGGTQYTDGGATPTHPVGTMPIFDDAGTITAVSAANPLPVSGTFWQATQPVSLASVPSHDVTNAGTFAVQSTLQAGSALVGKVGIDQTTPGTTNAVAATNLPTAVDTNSGNKSSSTLRVVLATDQPQLTAKLLVTPDANSAINQAQIGGNSVSTDVGATGSGVQRIVVANGAGRTLKSAGGSASTSGDNTLLVAGTNRLKVYAFSLSTTSATAITCIFQSGASGTELWRVVLQAPSSVSTGANIVVQPPAWLFATDSATLLNLNLSSANAVHWSVSYFDEA